MNVEYVLCTDTLTVEEIDSVLNQFQCLIQNTFLCLHLFIIYKREINLNIWFDSFLYLHPLFRLFAAFLSVLGVCLLLFEIVLWISINGSVVILQLKQLFLPLWISTFHHTRQQLGLLLEVADLLLHHLHLKALTLLQNPHSLPQILILAP